MFAGDPNSLFEFDVDETGEVGFACNSNGNWQVIGGAVGRTPDGCGSGFCADPR